MTRPHGTHACDVTISSISLYNAYMLIISETIKKFKRRPVSPEDDAQAPAPTHGPGQSVVSVWLFGN